MKTCPVCKTSVFDDMETCFGCMHRFVDEEEPEVEIKRDAIENDDVPGENLMLRVELREPGKSRSWTFELSR